MQTVRLVRRLAAMLYDSLVVAGLLLLSTLLLLAATTHRAIPPQTHVYQLFLVLQIASYYIGFWTYGGQTIGMLAWHLRLQHTDGGGITFTNACKRFLLSAPCVLLAGIGIIWQIFDKDRLALHDRFTGSKIIVLPEKVQCYTEACHEDKA